MLELLTTAYEQGVEMTTSAAFSAEEWTSVLEGPPSPGMIVITGTPVTAAE